MTRMTPSRLSLVVVLALAACATVVTEDAERTGRFSFGIWGDMPYVTRGRPDVESPRIPALIADMNAANLAFAVFIGDLKSGSSPCTDDVYAAAVGRFNTFSGPMIYVPGDNEWTDCHRTNNGGYDALERLAFIRRTMFATPDTFGQTPLRLERQGPPGGVYAENTRWTHGQVVLVALNVPGSNNNKVGAADCLSAGSARTRAHCDADNAEYAARDGANIAWMRAAFELAKRRGALAVVVIIHGNPGFDIPETETVDERTQPGVDGYDNFLAALVVETRAFHGQVVLVHGDTHYFRVDKPLLDRTSLLTNFTRVETFGSPHIHWVKVTVDPRSRNVFTFEPMIVPGPR
jgi:hypothetical protein